MTTDLTQVPCLVLNATYEAINIVSARRAFSTVLRGIAVVEKQSAKLLHTSHKAFAIPSVIRLLKYRKVPRRTRAYSRKGVLDRDSHTCQYCQVQFPAAQLTLDHVDPKSRGGESVWENLVACCVPCNNKKDNMTPEEAGMPLLSRPRPFSIHSSRSLLRQSALNTPDWQPYLFYN